jgi:fumarate hydratase, class II
VFQTGSGTSTNMNANEVIATWPAGAASRGQAVHPNDHVNMGQSSNDVIPTASTSAPAGRARGAAAGADDHLPTPRSWPRRPELDDVVKTGRTHLMDAMPVHPGPGTRRLAAQMRGWHRAHRGQPAAAAGSWPLGGTAVGTGINAHPEFGRRRSPSGWASTGLPFREAATTSRPGQPGQPWS